MDYPARFLRATTCAMMDTQYSQGERHQNGLMGVSLAGVVLQSPIVLAAGTAGYGCELNEVCDYSRIGAVITKSITREPREGNEPARIAGVGMGMLNAIGLANVGLDKFLRDKLPEAKRITPTLIGSIAGHSIDDYVAVAGAFDGCGEIPIVELNVSCPNTADGLVFGEDPNALAELLSAVRPVLANTKMMVKLSPGAPSITAMASAAVDGGADILSMINTFTALSIDVETRKPVISRGRAGLSGPGIHPIAVRMVRDVYEQVTQSTNTPIVAYGGVMTWQDAAEFILAGATAVGMGTALFVDPRIPVKVERGLEKWVRKQKVESITNLIGAMA